MDAFCDIFECKKVIEAPTPLNRALGIKMSANNAKSRLFSKIPNRSLQLS